MLADNSSGMLADNSSGMLADNSSDMLADNRGRGLVLTGNRKHRATV